MLARDFGDVAAIAFERPHLRAVTLEGVNSSSDDVGFLVAFGAADRRDLNSRRYA